MHRDFAQERDRRREIVAGDRVNGEALVQNVSPGSGKLCEDNIHRLLELLEFLVNLQHAPLASDAD